MKEKKMNESPERGKFIVFEGIDGAGKTTQINLLTERMRREGKAVFATAEPTATETGKMLRAALGGKIRMTPCELAALFVADRIRHKTDPEEGIEAKLRAGIDVVSDRYYYSTMAYQGSETDPGWVREMNLSCPEIRRPDLCIFLDLTPEQSMERIRAGRDSVEIYENTETLAAVRARFYRVIDELRTEENIKVVNAGRPIEEIAEEIFGLVSAL